MKGSYSIKYVLPALVPELSYQDLEIKEGGTASNTFYQMVIGEIDDDVGKPESICSITANWILILCLKYYRNCTIFSYFRFYSFPYLPNGIPVFEPKFEFL